MKAGGEIRERNQVTFDKDNLRLEMLDVKRKLLKKSVAFVLTAILVTGTTVCAEEPAEGDITEVEQPANPPNNASLDDMEV